MNRSIKVYKTIYKHIKEIYKLYVVYYVINNKA